VTEPFVPPGRASGPHPATNVPAPTFAQSRYRFTSGLRAGEVAPIRGDQGQVVLSYRAFASVVGVIAALVTVIVALAGAAGTAFLLAEGSELRALAALVLTLAFTFCLSLLVPRIDVTLYDEQRPALTISQESAFPAAWFRVLTPEGVPIVQLRKSLLSRLARNRWRIFQEGRLVGEASEDSFAGALVRKVLGKFSRRFETNVIVRVGGIESGRIIRRPEANGQYDLLELPNEMLDRRVAVALATLILGREP
jgi:hypothetical protein